MSALSARIFTGNTEASALMRSFDWTQTPLGPIEAWPISLCTAISLVLGSESAMFVLWGAEFVQFYNDACRPILGAKHPAAMGQRAEDCWREVWEYIRPMYMAVRAGGATHLQDGLLVLHRNGFPEECYFDYAYSPIRDESGMVAGLHAAVTETTARVIGGRRLAVLGELSARASRLRSVADVIRAIESIVADAAADLPFVLLYRIDGDTATLAACAGLERGTSAAPLMLTRDATPSWPVHDATQNGQGVLVDDLVVRFGTLVGKAWPEPIARALVQPLSSGVGAGGANMVLITGLSPRLAFDDTYRDFLQLWARQLDTSLATVRAVEHEQQRLVELDELNRQKIAFFSNVSHEFRTPLTLILSPLEDALASPQQVLQGAELAMVHHNARRLLEHVNSLLDFSRIEAGKFQAAYVPTDLATITTDVASAFRSLVERAGLRLTVECAALPDPIWVDHSMWEKVVSNLLSNAFKFTFEGEIAVRLRWCGDHIELAVTDTGTGIPKSALPSLFERFHRVAGAKGRSYEGSGIGLALVQEIVRVHGGTIAVTSELGRGSTFTVSIPAGHAHLPDDQVLSARGRSFMPTSDAFVLEAAAWLGAPSLASPEVETRSVPVVDPAAGRSALRQGRVLIADDNADMLEYVRRLLSGRFVVDAVADGDAALASAVANPPDLILADVMMPGLDGFALLRAIKANVKTTNVPIVLLSARAGEEAKIEGFAAGASDYLVKPFSSRELVARVEGGINVARARARLSEVLETMGDAFYVVDRAWRFVIVNASFERVTGTPRSETIGRILWDRFPDAAARDSKYWVELSRCMDERVPVNFLEYYAPRDLWTDVRGHPTAEGIAVFFRDVSEEKRAEVAIKQQAEFEQQLVGIVSHDLRNPLNVIQLASTILLQSGAHDERTMKSLARIASSTGRAIRLVRDLLDFTQARLGGGIPVEPRALDLHVLARQTVDEVQATYPERELQIAASGNGQGFWDSDRLAQVLTNLVSNALKYSPANTPVQVETHGSDDEVTLRVHNAGAPIPAEARARLFEPMQRANAHVDLAGRSVGLGLYIVKQIVTGHDGTVDVSSNEADGTTFTVRLPRRPVPSPDTRGSKKS